MAPFTAGSLIQVVSDYRMYPIIALTIKAGLFCKISSARHARMTRIMVPITFANF
jgi:hypothetical protein|tara:strand:- start:356 stop:520 length:165 start_codon:yes stop_codon:yes gene_type:complete